METSDTFALMIRPAGTWFTAADNSYYSHLRPERAGGFEFELSDKKDASKSIRFSAATEAELWSEMLRLTPAALTLMERHSNLDIRGLGARAKLFLERGEAWVLGEQEKLNNLLIQCNTDVIDTLGGRRISKARPRTSRLQFSKVVTPWWIRSTVLLPMYPDKTTLTLRMLPSPLNNTDWNVQVMVPAATNKGMYEIQQQLENVTIPFLASKGVISKSITQGTYLEI